MELLEVSAEFELVFRPDSFGHWRRSRLRRILLRVVLDATRDPRETDSSD